MGHDWDTGLFGCFEDVGGCIQTICCPCITLASNRAKFDDRYATCMDYCCACILRDNEYFFRQHVRAKYNMPLDDQFVDCLAVSFCYPCVLCQHKRVVEKKGKH